MIKQSINLNCFARNGVPHEKVIRRAAEIGYRSVEMMGQEHWGLVRELGLDIAIIGGHRPLPVGFNHKENHDSAVDQMLASIELAAANGIPALICFSGNRKGVSEEEGRDNCIEGLRRVIGAAEEKGITVCMELLNSKVNHKDYQCDRVAWGVEVCKGVGSPCMKLLFDIYHVQIMEGDLIRNIRDHIDYIGHFHTAGNPDRRDLDDQQEIYYPAVMRAIAATGYEGYVGHEFVPKADPLAALQAAFDVCNV